MPGQVDRGVEEVRSLVLDEQRILTYRWVAINMGINADAAKRLLYHFVTLSKTGELDVIYLIMGRKKVGGSDQLECALVPHDDLQAAKAEFDDDAVCHVYSVAPAAHSKKTSTNDLWAVDAEHGSDIISDNHNGQVLRSHALAAVECKSVKFDISLRRTVARPSLEVAPISAAPSSLSGTTAPAVQKDGPPKKSMVREALASNFFSKTTSKTASSSHQTGAASAQAEQTKPSKAAAAKKGTIGSFFGKGKKEEKPAAKASPVAKKDAEVSKETVAIDVSEEPVSVDSDEEEEWDDTASGVKAGGQPRVATNPSPLPPIEPSGRVHVPKSVPAGEPRKNRYEDDVEEEESASGEEVVSKISGTKRKQDAQSGEMERFAVGTTKQPGTKRTKKVLQSRVFEDDKGYLQHIEEWVEVTDDELEPEPAKAPSRSVPAKKLAPPSSSSKGRGKGKGKAAGGKQQMGIGSFFKK
jgi:DNA polymerase delta subunit 3